MWSRELQLLSNIPLTQPQAAYYAYMYGTLNMWTYHWRTYPNINNCTTIWLFAFKSQWWTISHQIKSNNHCEAKVHSVILHDKLPKSLQWSFDLANEKGASNWLSVIPIKEHCFDLHKVAVQRCNMFTIWLGGHISYLKCVFVVYLLL